eukprot:13560783-Alexandrium_andersonii.AAC.1
MSASLVGSEMCIRDRPQARHEGTERGEAADGQGPHQGCCLLTCPRSPVSYTHLTLPTICSV